MRRTDDELSTTARQLERLYDLSGDYKPARSPDTLFDNNAAAVQEVKPRARISSLLLAVLTAASLVGIAYTTSGAERNNMQFTPIIANNNFNAFAPNPWGIDPHTAAGAAEIHALMQKGEVNVDKATITGIVDNQSLTASFYWTMKLKNNNNEDKEASVTIELPKNSAVSRATLWINGVAQEAAFGSNSQVKEAYDYVVVRHRDPLLVTQIAPNKIKVLAAPVPTHGEMQIRLGITVPFESTANGHHRITLPNISESNLKFDCKQDVHLTSETPIKGLGTTDEDNFYTLRANVPINELRNAAIAVSEPDSTEFATPLIHTSPREYVVANVENGKLKLKRVSEKPSCKLINDDDVSTRISNIWAHQEIERLAALGRSDKACDLANTFRIISSVSGAVVLENDGDYLNNGLNRDMNRVIGGPARLQSAPMLQGVVNGTIGPQGSDATVISGINTAGTVRVNNLANLEALLNILSNGAEILGLALAVFIASEAFQTGSLHFKKILFSKRAALATAACLATAALYTPSLTNYIVATLRDLNMFS